MAAVTNPLIVLPAVAGLLALTQTTGDCAFNAGQHSGSQTPSIDLPHTAGVSATRNSLPILPHPGSSTEEEAQEAQPLSCVQIQAIDEVELLSEPTPGTDCD